MNKKIIEKLQDSELAQKMKKEICEIIEELYLKDLQSSADILEIPIDEEGNTTCTKGEQKQFLVLMYGILQYQIARLENAQNSIFATIKKMDSKIAKELIDLELSQEE